MSTPAVPHHIWAPCVLQHHDAALAPKRIRGAANQRVTQHLHSLIQLYLRCSSSSRCQRHAHWSVATDCFPLLDCLVCRSKCGVGTADKCAPPASTHLKKSHARQLQYCFRCLRFIVACSNARDFIPSPVLTVTCACGRAKCEVIQRMHFSGPAHNARTNNAR